MNTEGGRISRVVEDARRCDAAQALARARAFAARGGCGAACKKGNNEPSQEPLLESDYLEGKVAACTAYTSPYKCVPESVRIAAIDRCTQAAYFDAFTPEQRFAEYRRPLFEPPCPPIPQEALNANVPKMQMKRCPLPNKPDNPVLPG